MAIGTWHKGKLILLWAWTGILVTALLQLLRIVPTPETPLMFFVGAAILLAIFGIPIAVSVVTWKWLSGLEARAEVRRLPGDGKEPADQ